MRILIAVVCLVSFAAMAETYRWVDENGVVNYSDSPHPGAEVVNLQAIETTRFARTQPSSGGAGEGSEESGPTYESVEVQRPQPEETLWNLEGFLDVQIATQPSIRRGHRLQLFLDGQQVAGVPARSTSFTIDRVYRGAHTLMATIVDGSGRQVGQSQPVRFYVQQTSIQNPQGPGRPTPTPLPSRR